MVLFWKLDRFYGLLQVLAAETQANGCEIDLLSSEVLLPGCLLNPCEISVDSSQQQEMGSSTRELIKYLISDNSPGSCSVDSDKLSVLLF